MMQAFWTFFPDKEGQEKTRKMADDCDGRSQQKQACRKRRSDRPSKYKIKIKFITLIFKLYLTGYQRQLHHRRGGRPFAMRENKDQPPARTRFRVIHETSNFYIDIKILIYKINCNIVVRISMKGPYRKIWYHFQRTDNKFAKAATIQPCTYAHLLFVCRSSTCDTYVQRSQSTNIYVDYKLR